MTINKDSLTNAVTRALKAERDNVEVMNPGIGFYKRGDEITFRYESELSPTERIHFVRWEAGAFGIHDRVSEMTDDQIRRDASGVLEIFEDEILEDILDVLNEEY